MANKPESVARKTFNWRGLNKQVVYSTVNSRGMEEIVLFDLETRKAIPIYERKIEGDMIERVRSCDGGVLFSVSNQEFYRLDIKSGELTRLLEDEFREGSINFTSQVNGHFAYSISQRGECPFYDRGKGQVYLFDLNSGKSKLVSESREVIGCMAFNGKKLAFTRIANSNDGWTPGGGYEKKDDYRLEYLISLEIDGDSVRNLGDIESLNQTHLSHIAMNRQGAISEIYNSRSLWGDIRFDWWKPDFSGLGYLSDDTLAVAGTFASQRRYDEPYTYWTGFKILRKNEEIHEVEVKGRIGSFSVIDEENK